MIVDARRADVVIVDAKFSDYVEVAQLARDYGLCLLSVVTGRDALRVAGQLQPHLWLVNTCLPDVSGFDVVERLRSLSRDSRFFCVSETYRSEEEIRARLLRTAAYLCKPVQPEWIVAWVSKVRKQVQLLPDSGSQRSPLVRVQ